MVAPAAPPVPVAVSPADLAVDLIVGVVIFVLVVLVAAFLMFILQAVLPDGADPPSPAGGAGPDDDADEVRMMAGPGGATAAPDAAGFAAGEGSVPG